MLSEYTRALQSYTEQKGKKIDINEKDNTFCNSSGDYLEEGGDRTLTTLQEMKNGPAQNPNLENEFIIELKTCGLKAVKENKLISIFQRIVCFHKDSAGSLRSMLHESKELNKSYKSIVNRQELDIGELREENLSISSTTENLRLECEKMQESILLYEHKIEDTKKRFANEKDGLLKKNQTNMDLFLSKMDSEVEAVRSSMKEEAEKMIQKSRSTLVKEKDVEVRHLNEIISRLQVENEKYKDYLNLQRTESISEADSLNAKIEDGRVKLKNLEAKLKLSDEALLEKESRIQYLEQSLENNNNCWNKKMNTLKQEREKELGSIEQKVKQIVHSKDEKIRLITDRALIAEARQKELEDFFRNIESGFTEVGS